MHNHGYLTQGPEPMCMVIGARQGPNLIEIKGMHRTNHAKEYVSVRISTKREIMI